MDNDKQFQVVASNPVVPKHPPNYYVQHIPILRSKSFGYFGRNQLLLSRECLLKKKKNQQGYHAFSLLAAISVN